MANESKAQLIIYNIINPFINLLIRLKITPNFITTVGLLLNILAAIIFILGAEKADRTQLVYVGWGGFTILIAGLFDMIDGRLARLGNMSSKFGAFYDSVVDRYSELIMFLGICYYLIAHHFFLSSLFAFIALIGSMMVSYTTARAEGIGIACSVGMMQRPARVVSIGAGAMFCGIFHYFFGNICI
ncbi:MAG: CDP-alcohol phosphatidyltransferase family protein, partial [Flavobacteriales bacterium]|nr:CDP-alcohol phosphatidyltransferase family protein [Flavobacteriales bacterium]